MKYGFVPPITAEVFMILRPYLPQGTYLSSAYRSPSDQLEIIRNLAREHGVPLPQKMDVESSSSWLPVLRTLRSQHDVIVNAPKDVKSGPRHSPHSDFKAVFDLSHPNAGKSKSLEARLKALDDIVKGCELAEKAGLMTFGQKKIEVVNRAVHCHVRSVSSRALKRLYMELGYAIA
jgi:hypothetical protein